MSIKALLIGLVGVVTLGIVTPMCDMLGIGTHIGATYMPTGALFLFFFVVLILNLLLKLFRVGLKPQELFLIYAMMFVSSGLPSCGFTSYLIPVLVGPFYYATPENRFAEVLHKFIPGWMTPRNPDTIKYFFEGIPKGMSIPYKDWVGPLFWWMLLMLAVCLVMYCLAIVVRKQWVENEKLVFPLVFVPVEMVKESETKGSEIITPFFKNKLMWIGFLIPAVIYMIKGLHFYFPAIPDINLLFRAEGFFTDKPWNAITKFWFQTIFAAIGFTYFVPTSVSFSIWFFYLFFNLQIIMGSILGLQMPNFPGGFNEAFICYQVAGGIIAFTILLFWAMRANLTDMIKKLFSKDPSEKQEANNMRLLFAGLVGGFLFICFWAMAAGVHFWTILVWSCIFFAMTVVTTRFVAEAGLFYVHYQMFPLEIFLPFTGSAPIGGAGIMTLLSFNQAMQREFRVSSMPFFLNNIKMADTVNMDKKGMGIAMWIAMIVVIPVSFASVLHMCYKYGGVNIGGWWTIMVTRDLVCSRAVQYIVNPVPPNVKDVVSMVVGAGVTVFLFWMRRVFLWWPFHPIGYIMGGGYAIYHIWWPVLLGWAAKSIILKFGGIKIYQKLMPTFIGLILGETVTIGAWIVVDLILGTRGNFLLWI